MENFTFKLLGLFCIFLYLSTLLFFWAIFKENCSACNNSSPDKNNPGKIFGHPFSPIGPNLRGFIHANWKPLILSGLMYLGAFGFFMTHTCSYL